MTADDTAAVVTLVQSASSPLATRTFVTNTPSGAVQDNPYALVHPHEGNDEQSRLTGPLLTRHPSFTLHLVSGSAASVQATLDLVKAKFVVNGFAVNPTVTGRINRNAWWRSPLPIQTDASVTPWLIYAVCEFGWESDPA